MAMLVYRRVPFSSFSVGVYGSPGPSKTAMLPLQYGYVPLKNVHEVMPLKTSYLWLVPASQSFVLVLVVIARSALYRLQNKSFYHDGSCGHYSGVRISPTQSMH